MSNKLLTWDPARELDSLQTELDRVFGGFLRPGTTTGWIPPVDVLEHPDRIVLRADLPGLAPDDLAIEFENGMLRLSGERRSNQRSEGAQFVRSERSWGRFERSFRLPREINPEAIEATFEDGVLELMIPKPEAVKPRRIPIATARQSLGSGEPER